MVLFVAAVLVFVLGLATTALAVAPQTYNEADPAFGRSAWTYKDLQDADAKYEGSYAIFDDTSTAMYNNPHGGYDTGTNQCKVCHAVHRANGAYYLLRADSQDDACSYCHIGGSAHSDKVVYDANPDGIYTTNGHTIGAQTQIPDSSESQEATAVTLSTTDANGDPLEETIHVRSYETAKNEMYRFGRHHSQSPVSTGRSGYAKIGPLALRCMNCHQPHNATELVWKPRDFTPFTSANYSTATDGAFRTSSYKLLRRYPSASTYGTVNSYGYWDDVQAIKAIEDSATAGLNFSQEMSAESTYTENGVTRRQPLWIAQDIHKPDPDSESGIYRYPNKVNNMALSWWCADCHNLNVGGWEPLTDPELGFKAHTERTHPAPYYGAYTGPGQCYSCHRNDLSPQMGLTAATNPDRSSGYAAGHTVGGVVSATAITGSSRNGCTQCHYGTGDYYRERVDGGGVPVVESDFPHSGGTEDIKMLGNYSASVASATASYAPTYSQTTVTENNLDAVCLRCHPGVGIHI